MAGDALGSSSSLDLDAGRRKTVQGQVDAVQRPVVVLTVLQVVQHLQRIAQRIGIRVELGALAVQIEQETADRRGGQRAVAEQILPVAIAKLGRIVLEGGEQVERVLRRHAGRGQARAQRLRLGQRRGRLRRPGQRKGERSSRAILSSGSSAGLSPMSSAARTNA